jgi:hypothetical protein
MLFSQLSFVDLLPFTNGIGAIVLTEREVGGGLVTAALVVENMG